MSGAQPPAGTAEIEISIGGYEIRHLAVAVLAQHCGGVSVTTVPDADGRAPDELDAVRRLSRLLDERAAAEDPYPEVDEDGEWQVRLDGTVVTDVAVVFAGCHDGLMAAACVPNSDGRALNPDQVRQLVHTLEARLMENPDGDEPPRLVFGRRQP